MSSTMSRDNSLKNTYCSRGHIHPPWNTTGVLRIAKCESVCGFCQKETKTAANLRKHVAIHIKNEGMNLSIAEGSSGRGRLEMPPKEQKRPSLSPGPLITTTAPTTDAFSAPAVLLSMSQPYTHSLSQVLTSNSHSSYASPPNAPPSTSSSTPSPISTTMSLSRFCPQDVYSPEQLASRPPDVRSLRHQNDPFWALRSHNLPIKTAWTAIPAAEGFKILDFCKRNSVTTSEVSPSSGGLAGEGMEGVERLPCYNRKILFDEEWQAHMRDVHGVFLLWPQTWMKRIEVLDLEPFGGDIGICNDVIMAS